MAVTSVFSERFLKATQGLQDLMNSYPGMEMGHHLLSHLHSLTEQASPISAYPIEVLFLDTPNDEQLYKFFDFFKIDPSKGQSLLHSLSDSASRFTYQYMYRVAESNFAITLYNSAHLPVRSTAAIAPCLKLIFWFSSEAPLESEIEPILLRMDAEGGVVWLIHANEENFMDDLSQLKVFGLKHSDLPSLWEEILSASKITAQLPVLHSMRLLQSLEKVSDAFYQFIAQQEKDIKTKKFNAQQDINTVKIEEKLNLRDLFQQLKTGLQRDFSESERGILDQLAKLSQRHTAQSLMAQIEQQIQEVQHLREENFAGNIRMTLPENTVDNLKRTLYQGLRLQIEQQIFSFKEFVKQECESIAKELFQHHIDFVYHPQMQINLSRVEANMAEYVHFGQKYEVEKKPLQVSDYIRAATAPFMTVMSVFLLTRFIPPLKKLLNETTMIAISCVLLPIAVYGFYKFLQNTKARKAHDYDSELNRMRENLLVESKSIIRKVGDEWQREIISALRDELNALINSLEIVFAQAGEQHKDKVQQAQRSVQRRVQGLEQRERAHQTTMKNKETFDRSLAQFKGELMHHYQQNIQQL